MIAVSFASMNGGLCFMLALPLDMRLRNQAGWPPNVAVLCSSMECASKADPAWKIAAEKLLNYGMEFLGKRPYRRLDRRSAAPARCPNRHAGVVELVDAPDSKSGSERSVGSIPTARTIFKLS